MEIILRFGSESKKIEINLPQSSILIAKSKNPSSDKRWSGVVGEVLNNPIEAKPIRNNDLKGKRVAIITDDWARPTPASEATSLITEELKYTGVDDVDITFVTASGMHAPMSKSDLERKLGKDIVAKYRCISHDGGDWDNLSFCGISPQGTPIWINKYVAEADYKIALGRIYLHEAYGYEGGYKMILPGVSGFDTITRDHSFNFSADSISGIHENPSRREADAVGQIVGIDFLINVVVNAKGQPIKAFCGEPLIVHRSGIEYGDREVWGAEIGEKADVVIASSGSENIPESYDLNALYIATRAVKESGTIICLTKNDTKFDPKDGKDSIDESLFSLNQQEFQAKLSSLSFPEIFKLHEKRNWNLDEREVQYRIKSVRGEFYRRRTIYEIKRREVILTADPNPAIQNVIAKKGSDIKVIVLLECKTTMPKERLYK
ncbi:MAG: lactate racemase domain-containing protein [Candidatus Poribacteria bacterium]